MDNTFKFYRQTEETWDAMLEGLRSAKSSIDIEHYIFFPDEAGNRFLEVLKDKARSGVKVRLLLDMVGSYPMYLSQAPRELAELGIEIKFWNQVRAWQVHNIFSWFFRDHNKLIIIDKKIAFTGGTGLQKEMAGWRDTNARLEGTVVEEMLSSFEEMWDTREKHFTKRIRKIRARVEKKFFISNIPYFKKRFLYYAFIKSISNARKSVYLTTPYFVPDHKFMRALKRARRQGADIKIIVPKVLDVPIVGTAANSLVQGLLELGVRIYKYEPAILHAKTAVIDEEWTSFGSFNLDSISFNYNFEGNVVTAERVAIKAITNQFNEDLKVSQEILLSEWRKRSFIKKLQEFLIIPIRGFL